MPDDASRRHDAASAPEDSRAADATDDRSATVERFARDLWNHRTALASALETQRGDELTEREALLAAQRILDRVVFLCFLLEGGVVVRIDESRTVLPGEPGEILETVVRGREDVLGTLGTDISDRLTSRERDELSLTESRSLYVPYLGGDPFRSITEETVAGDRVDSVTELVVSGFDWDGLVTDLVEYDWRLDDRDAGDPTRDSDAADRDAGHPTRDSDTAGGDADDTLTPAILGYVYERFVVAMSEAGDDVPLRDLDPDARDGHPSSGNAAVGAYYTGEAVTDFTARRALWEALREKIDADRARGRAPDALGELYRPAEEQRREIEGEQRDGFDVLVEAHGDDPAVLAYVDDKLRTLTVCDPAVGSGSFALAVANTLLEWRSTCAPEADEYALRRQIVAENVFGVDVLAGAAVICRLRLWLWTLSAAPVELRRGASVETRRAIPPAPDVAFDVRTGNSLLGFARPAALDGDRIADGASASALRDYAETVRAHRGDDASDPAVRRELRTRHDELRRAFDARYAAAQREPATDPPRVEDHVDDAAAARASIEAGSVSTTLCVAVADGIPDAIERSLVELGFTTYTYKARLPDPSLSTAERERIFERLQSHFDDPDAWTVFVEREYVGDDFAPDGLDALHWPLAFPAVFLDDGGFDVVVGNPPYGASVSPEAAPLLHSERNYECQGASDTCEWFYERALDLVHGGGVVSFVVSKSVAFYSSWSDVREKLLSETEFTHVFDVGLGFDGVNLETVAIVQTVRHDGAEPESTPTVHRSRDRRRPAGNRPVHLGWVDQRFMRDSETIIFRPISEAQSDVLGRILSRERRLGDVMSSDDTTRQLYVPDREKASLGEGTDAYVDANPSVRPYHLADVWHADLSDYREEVNAYAVPRVMLKVLRGSRLRAWLDPAGELVGTEKLVNVPMADSGPAEIAFVYAALNHPCVSFYLQKAVFSETTETARVMDGHYSAPIPIPAPPTEIRDAVAQLAWTLTLAKQLAHDADRDIAATATRVNAGLDALVAGLYLDDHHDRLRSWTADLHDRGPPRSEVRDTFESFYTARFAERDGRPERHWDDVEAIAGTTAAVTERWETDAVLESPEMCVVRRVL
jgi:hypothetical protein